MLCVAGSGVMFVTLCWELGVACDLAVRTTFPVGSFLARQVCLSGARLDSQQVDNRCLVFYRLG